MVLIPWVHHPLGNQMALSQVSLKPSGKQMFTLILKSSKIESMK